MDKIQTQFEYQEAGKKHEDTVEYDDMTSQRLQENKKITEIKFYWSDYMMGAEIFYDNKPSAPHISKNGYIHSGSISVSEGEHIVEIRGRAGALVDNVTVLTSLGREKDFGESKGGQPFKLRGAPGSVLRGVKIGTGAHLHFIGAYFGHQIENKQLFYKEAGNHHKDTKTIDTLQYKDHRITDIKLFSEQLVYGLEMFAGHHSTGLYKGSEKVANLTTETLRLEPGENINEIQGRYKDVIAQLTFITTKGRHIHGGKKKGKFDIALKGPPGTVVRALKFGVNGHMHFIGAYFDLPVDDTNKPSVVEKIENFAADAIHQLAEIEAKKLEERKEFERKEHERLDIEKKEHERREVERLEHERKEHERKEEERREHERKEEERREHERKEVLRLEEEAKRELEKIAHEKKRREEEEAHIKEQMRIKEEEEQRRREEEEQRRREEEIKLQQEEEQIKARSENVSPDTSPKKNNEEKKEPKVNPKIAPLPTPTIDVSVEEMDNLIFKTGTAGTSDAGDTTFDHFTTIFKKFGFRKLLEFHVYHNTIKILGIEIVYDYPANLTISRKVVDHKRSDIQKSSLILSRDEKIVSIKVAFGAELDGITINTSNGRTLQSGDMNAPETREWSKEGHYLCCFGGSFGLIKNKNEKALKGLYAYHTNL